ncbi:MAG: endonuclease [Candidatus Cloacimonetes bacterium]|nr:endonuclease [Candidatus Cloacimonadota bacterium]
MKIKIAFLICFIMIFSVLSADYYDGTQGLTGETLKSALHDIIDDHTTYSYDDLRDFILPNTDEDPDNSNNVVLLYTCRSQPKSSFGGGADDWNREHVWAKSHGDFGNTVPCGTDAHHVRPTDASVNSYRGNKDFDYGGDPLYDCGDFAGWVADETYEPRDEVKGDVARMIFYMAVRYEGDSGEPDLEIVDYVPSSPAGEPYHAKLSTLLEWHQNDPVDNWEETRNDKIYDIWQHNRNPFIDHPEFAHRIWEDTTLAIYDIQYTTEPGANGTYPSLLEGMSVTTEGIVMATGYNGNNFFIEDEEGGAWNGIYVYDSALDPVLGDKLSISGEISEYYGFTEFTNITSEVVSSGNAVPEPVVVNTGELQEPGTAEKYESVLIKVQNVEVTQEPDDYGQWYVDDGSGACQIDDEIFSYSPTLGEEFEYIIGVVDYSYDKYAINPRQSDDLEPNGISEPGHDDVNIDLENYPNPVKKSTTISLEYKTKARRKTIKIYDISGSLVKVLLAKRKGAEFVVVWNCDDTKGLPVKNGMYFYQINIQGKDYSNKLLILK